MKVFFDIITNHTADVIDYEGGQYAYVDKATRALPGRRRQRLRRPRLRRRQHLPGAGPRDVLPVHAGVPHRRRQDRQGPGLAERPDDVPQPRRLDLRRRVHDVRRLRRARRPVDRAARRSSTAWPTSTRRGSTSASTASASTPSSTSTSSSGRSSRPAVLDHAKADGKDDFFMFGEVYDADPSLHEPRTRRPARCPPRSTSPSRRSAARLRRRASRRPSCATSSPATTTTPTPTPTPTSCRPSSATTTWAGSA